MYLITTTQCDINLPKTSERSIYCTNSKALKYVLTYNHAGPHVTTYNHAVQTNKHASHDALTENREWSEKFEKWFSIVLKYASAIINNRK